MKVRLKCGDRYIEVDSELDIDEVDTFEQVRSNDLEDTLEFEKISLDSDENED